MAILKKYSEVVFAIDNSEEALKYCSKKPYDKIVKSNMEDFQINQKFDLIICMDVFEHIKDDDKAIKNIKAHMDRNGMMVFSVPAHDYLWNNNDIFSQHYRRYSMKKIKRIMDKNNLEIIKLNYWNKLLYMPSYVYYRLLKQRAIKNNLELIPDIFNKLLYFLMKIENKYFKGFNLLPGVSIVGVVRKK